MAAGGTHATAFATGYAGNTPTLFGWGFNNYGQVGDTTNSPRSFGVQVAVTAINTPTVVVSVANQTGFYSSSPVQVGVNSWTNVSAGGAHTIATNSSGLYAWGLNQFGEVGDRTMINKSSPVQISTSSFTNISAGSYHTTTVRNDGIAITFGNNSNSQLGDGT